MRHILWAIAMLFVGSAQAGVVYNWETIDSAGYISPATGLSPVFSGRIEIDDAVWLSGSASHVNTPVCPPWMCSGPADFSDPANPVLQFSFDGLERPGWAIDLRYRTGQGVVVQSIGEFSLVFGALMSGSVEASNGETGLTMSSVGSLWTISYFDSDAGRFCAVPADHCAGVTGLWVLDLATIPVPAPGTLALILPWAALGLGALRRKENHRFP